VKAFMYPELYGYPI